MNFKNYAGAIAIYGGGAFVALLLVVENEWGIAGLLLGGIALAFFIENSPLGAVVSAAFDTTAGKLAIHAIFAGALAAVIIHEEHFALLMLATVFLYGLVCVGLTIQFGYTGVLNFAGAAFFGIGGYTSAVLGANSVLPSFVILLCGGVAAAVIGAVLILPILRTKGHYAALITIAFGILFESFLEVNDGLGGPQGLKVASFNILGFDFAEGLTFGDFEASFYFNYVLLALLLFTAFLVMVKRLERSWVGLNLDAVREDEVAASAFGIDTAKWRITAFLLGNFIIGIAGAASGMMTNFVAPASFTFGDSLLMLAIVILGGLGNPWGILPATLLVIVIPEKLQVVGEYRLFLFAILVAFVLRFRSAGLFPRSLRTFQREVAE